MNSKIRFIAVFLSCLFYFPVDGQNAEKKDSGTIIRFDDTRNINWSKEFNRVEIRSGKDNAIQKAYFYKSASGKPMPLVVSLHTWSGDYTQKDELAELCRKR